MYFSVWFYCERILGNVKTIVLKYENENKNSIKKLIFDKKF